MNGRNFKTDKLSISFAELQKTGSDLRVVEIIEMCCCFILGGARSFFELVVILHAVLMQNVIDRFAAVATE